MNELFEKNYFLVFLCTFFICNPISAMPLGCDNDKDNDNFYQTIIRSGKTHDETVSLIQEGGNEIISGLENCGRHCSYYTESVLRLMEEEPIENILSEITEYENETPETGRSLFTKITSLNADYDLQINSVKFPESSFIKLKAVDYVLQDFPYQLQVMKLKVQLQGTLYMPAEEMGTIIDSLADGESGSLSLLGDGEGKRKLAHDMVLINKPTGVTIFDEDFLREYDNPLSKDALNKLAGELDKDNNVRFAFMRIVKHAN
jgi:hypothetical protein|tara:strand:+ start:1093 stop:1872 length:780 start_codon:yes stop_codon:yes gene_type:complete